MRANRGFALVSTTLILALLFAFTMIFVDSALSSRRAARVYQSGLSALQIAEAGINHALACLNATSGTNCGGTYGSSYAGQTDVTFGGGKFTLTLAASGSDKEITSVGTAASSAVATVKAAATIDPPTDEPAFNYALQAGNDGAHLENNAEIKGTLYSGGNVECTSTNARIDGDVYVSLAGGKIDACRVKFNGHADKILNSEIDVDAYYVNDPADIAGTDVDGTKHPGSATPAAQALPTVSLDFWRQTAEDGGTITGDYAPADNSSLGPKKIIGNLTLGQNVDLTVTGAIWVVGDIITENNSSLTLDSAFGAYSTAILADDPANTATKGKITIVNNTAISGSGNSKSHIMLITSNTSLSDTNPALSVANNASGAIFYAIDGTLRLQNNGGAKSMAAKRLFIDQNAEVEYKASELSDLNFSGGPPGSWKIKEGSWREAK
ncbi:hypothetical protein HY633_02465 [Candidatus Uhrbacteria bacterium]|nr:hypothetical protein [Candidatus Uhrbacteria bacterium]